MKNSPDWYYLPVIAIGMLTFLSGYFNWKWWMNSPRARQMVNFLGGNNRARQFYMIAGGAIVTVGVLGLLASL